MTHTQQENHIAHQIPAPHPPGFLVEPIDPLQTEFAYPLQRPRNSAGVEIKQPTHSHRDSHLTKRRKMFPDPQVLHGERRMLREGSLHPSHGFAGEQFPLQKNRSSRLETLLCGCRMVCLHPFREVSHDFRACSEEEKTGLRTLEPLTKQWE